MHVVHPPRHVGFANGCVCPNCTALEQGRAAGLLYYDEHGRLRLKDRPHAINGQALTAYMRLPKHKKAA